MKTISKRFTPCVLLASLLLANGMPLAWAQTKHRAVHSGVTATTIQTKGVAPNYECKSGTCTCTNAQDCGVMGGDHVCQEKSFVGSGSGGGSCNEKVQ